MDKRQPPGAVIAQCKEVLAANWRESFTVPAEGLYPHQWLWDSCFIAIGKSNYAPDEAMLELRNLLRGQWANGMLPHMIFSNHGSAAKDSSIWQSWRNANAPEDVQTSGLTQPPMLAEAVVNVGDKLTSVERRSWYQDMYPALLAYHQWLYANRDPHREGLALLIHPWESGLDNAPAWVEQMHRHSRPWWITVADTLKMDELLLLIRRDTKHVPPGQRLDSIDALLYYSVLQRLRRKNWDIDTILERSHFAIEDLAFNSIFVRANHNLRRIAHTIGKSLPEELLTNMKNSEYALDNLWDAYYQQYFSRNFITHKLIKIPSITTLLPLYAGTISKERAATLVAMLYDKKLFGSKYPVASVPLSSTWYKEHGYWQGPTWINTNWLICQGLSRYGYHDEAAFIAQQSIALVSDHGPFEYFSAKKGTPAGARNFSWSAALTIDFILHQQ